MKKKPLLFTLIALFVLSVISLCCCEQLHDEYAVTFKAGGEVVAVKKFGSVNDNVIAPAIPAKTGYNGSWENYSLTLSDITVNAVYTAKQYTVTLDYNGGTSENIQNTLTVTFDSVIGSLPVVEKTYYQFDGWYLNDEKVNAQTLWRHDGDAILKARFTQPSATLLDLDGATIEGKHINVTVAKDCAKLELYDIVIVSEGSTWTLYADEGGQTAIPTKIVTPRDGNVDYYLVVSDSVNSNTYTLTVYRPYDVMICYLVNDEVVHSEQVEAEKQYELTYRPDVRGYSFESWMDENNSRVTSVKPTQNINLYAEMSSNEYECLLDVNGGEELQNVRQTVAFGHYFYLPVPVKSGYDFLGWFIDDIQIADSDGESIAEWEYDQDKTAVALWEEINDKTIVFYSTQGAALSAITQKAITAFQIKHPGWTVKHQTIGGYDDLAIRILSDLQSGSQPDLAYCYGQNVAQYMPYKKLIDWSKYMSFEYKADFVQSFLSESYASNLGDYESCGYSADDMLLMPFVKSGDVMFYNVDALEQCGLTVPATWDELWLQCAELKGMFPNCTPLGVDSESNWFISTCYQNGWGYLDKWSEKYLFNGKQQQDWLDMLKEKFNYGYFTTQQISGSYSSALLSKGLTGGAVFSIGSSAGASHYLTDGINVGVAPIPGGNSVLQGPSLCMFASDNFANDDERKQMTFEFAQELWNSEFLAEFCQSSGYAPSRQSVYNETSFAEFVQGASLQAQALRVIESNSGNMFVSPAFIGSDTARTQVGSALINVLRNNVTGEQALQVAFDNCLGRRPDTSNYCRLS